MKKTDSRNPPLFAIMRPGMGTPGKADTPKVIGERLRLIRIAYGRLNGIIDGKGLSQTEFARLCGIPSRQALNNMEKGRQRIGFDSAGLIYARTGADPLYIYYGETRAMPLDLMREIEKIKSEEASRKD